MNRRLKILLVVVVAIVGGMAAFLASRFPPDTTPTGAYMRVARAISGDEVEECFAYLEEEAQQSTFTIVDYAKKASARIEAAYPEPAKSVALARYALAAGSADGKQLWARMAAQRNWVSRLRRDLSGVATVEIAGERATVVTARGTRYAFRRRPNGIWGLTMFTAELSAEAEHMARDWELIQRAAKDYEQAGDEAGH
jgi:hypothetical protein